MDVSEESIDSECNLFELPANEEKIGKTRAKSALGQNTHTGLIRRCRRKANPQPEIAKDLNASATLEGKVTHGRPKGGKTSCGEVPPAKKQKLDTLEQTQDSGNIETAKGSALTCEGEPASSKTKHVENNIVTNDVQFEGQTGDCQHRSKKIKVEATSLSPSYKHIWKNDTSLKTNVNQCHFNENCFICNICNVTSPSKESYKKHISSVRHKKQAISTSQDTITKEGFNCRLCGHLLPSRYDLDKHIKENHSKRSKAHICPQCKFKAESAALLQAHLKHKHFQKERLSCDLCGYQCYDENLLKTHCRGKTHLRRKNLAARGGYIHLLSKKGLSDECGAKDKVRNAKLLNKRPGNLRKTRNRCLVQKDAKQSTECLGKSTRIGNNLCVEEGNSNKMPMANDQIELNDCHAGKASPRRTLRSIKEPSNLLQERGGNQRLRRSGNGNVSWRLRSARCKVNSEHSQSTRSRLSKEEVANRKSPRKLQRRANLSTKNNSRSQGQFPHKREVFPEAQQKSGSVAGSKNGDVKETSKPISQESNQLEGKSQNQSKSTDMTLTDANLEDENAFKISCSSYNQEGASTPSEIPNSLVENNIESTSGDQNLESPSANPTNTKASKVENTESKLSPADRKALRTCSYCGHLFQNRKGLEVHIKRRHTKEMVFHCQPCGYACVTKGDFEKHCQSNRHQLNFSKIDCWLCTFVTSDEETLKDHMNQKHKIVAYCRHCKVHFVSKDDLVDHVGTEQHARNMFPQQKETTTEQTEKLQPRELELNKTSSSDTKEESTVQKANPLIDPQKPSITRVVAGNILKRSTHSRTQLQCKHCFYKARSASVLLKHIRLRHAQEYRFYCKVCSLYTISKEAMEKHIKRTRHIMNAKKQSLGPSVEECIEEVSVGVWDIQKTMKTQEALGNVNTEIDKGYVQVLEPSKPKEEFVVTWEIPEGDTDNVEDAQKNSDLQSTGSVKRGRPKGNISRTCLYCGLLASSVTNLNIHIRRKHSHQYSYFCKTCNYYTVTKGDMDRHCNTKKHKNQVDVSKTELCRKIATSPDKDHPQVIVSDVASVSMAEDVQNSSKGLKPETPDVKNQSGNTENCTRVNLESFPSTQVQQKMENQNEIVVVLDVESNDMGQNGSSSNSKPRKENHTTTCVYCGFMAYSLATLEMHVKRKHTKDFDYYCMACAYYAVTRREMMRHAITEKHKLKSRSYLKLNLNKGRDSSTVLTVAPENEHQKEGNEHQMDEGSWNEEGGISKASQDAFQKSVSSIIETEKAVEDSEVVSAAKETAAVSKMAENQVKSLQNEVAEEEENIQTLSAVCYSEISSETYSGILEANTAHSNAPLDIESHAAELKSVSLESAVLETIQNQISQSPNEQDSSSFYKDIVTSQKTNVKNNDIDLHVEASQTEENDFQQLSEAGESREDEQNVKPAEVAKEISSSLDSRPNEMVDPGQNHPNNYDIEEEENMEEGLLASTKDVEGSSVQGGCHLQPGKNSEHIHVNRVQQIDSNYQNIKAVSEEMSVQGAINPPHDFGGSENFLDDQNKGEADLKEKAGDMKSANENSQELEITESTGDNLKLDLQGKGFQKYFEFDASIVRLKNKFGSEKSECTDNSEDSQGADGVSPDEWAVAVYKTDTSQVMKKRKNKGSLFQYPKRIRCEDCGFLADGVNGLNVHIAMKHPSAEKHFHCFLCGKSFYTESNLHQHLASMGHQRMEQESIEELPEGGATFKCVKCNTAFDLEEYLFVHIKQKHGEMLREVNKYIVEDTEQINCERQENQGNVCKYCGKVCKSSNSLAFLAHIRTHTGSKPFRCTLCNFATAQLGDARNHVKRHLGVREYKCHICGWAFVMKKHLSTHLLGKHGIGTPKERKFVCEICDRTFTEKWALTNHKKLHMGQKPFKCTWLTCHYSFLTASAMRDHFRTHTGEKSFLCDLCGFAGGTRHALTKHRRQHTGEKPFKCDQCNFASTTQSHLTRHRRVHTGEKPYKCPWCDYRSNCAENIRKHILHTGKHEGVQMYNCPKCDYGTNIPLEFRNHLKELHPDIENPDLAYLHAGIVSKAYECRLKGQGAQFVETAVPVNPPRVVSTEITGDSLGGCIEQQESADSIGQVFIIQGYQVGCGEEISIDTSVEATAAATLQTLAMVGQMTQVAKVMHITEDGQIIDTTQTTTHVSNMVPEQTVTQQPISDATQEAAGKEPTEQGSATEAAIAMETLTDSNQVERVVTQEDEAKPTSERPTALVALLCAVTEVGAIEARSAEQEGSESTQEGSYSMNSAIENVISTQKESVHEGTETFHKDQTVQETTEAEGTVSNIEQQISVTTTQEGSQVAFSDVVQEVLQFTMCDMRTTSHIVKDGVTRVIVAKEGTTHVVEGASQIIVQEGEEQTIATNGHPMRLVDSSGEISQIIITEEVLQAMVQETTGHLSEEATHVIVTEVPHNVVNGDHSRAVTEVYPQRVMELVNEDMSSSSQSVATVALAECYTEDRSEVVMIELPAKEEQEMEIDGIQEA
ncbi:zinc finger protein 407 isoform X1 [Chiloscyllium plagiosum]|uniref:zinc finger protein 407 isoform X1 n=1 Tax=Chiloscyllium plagiosum TaxID=36176 RepID=UPI001CB831AD|nr:zinc finger protein 407 isoform X1 [Chiloscyllium plagiosum]XP_043544582.1 zinc finger protein 407 isoform X1 [Chiloscyllium plagiosum]